MSSLYNVEPPPTAKVVLCTTSGEILLELFAQQTPLASRNFLQLCLDGYYDNTIFHRLVPGFVIQGGDPTGNGSGGQSCYDGGKPFADEFHSRLKFNRRGLLGMANTGTKDENGSQFFITLDKTEELQGRNTMFGRVEGQTVFNVLKMGEADLVEGEDSERPLYPTMIKSTEILVNPFKDMVKRMRVVPRTVDDGAPVRKKPKKKATKQMLSFEDDEGGDAAPATKAAKFNPKLVNGDQGPVPRPSKSLITAATMERRRRKSDPPPSPSPETEHLPLRNSSWQKPRPETPCSSSPTPEPDKKAQLLERTNDQIANLTKSLKRSQPIAPTEEPTRKKTALEAMMPATATRGRKRNAAGAVGSKDERHALDQFNAFKSRLEAATEAPESRQNGRVTSQEIPEAPRDEIADGESGQLETKVDANDDDEATLCDLHFVPNCESCRKWDNVEDDEDDVETGLISHTLSFAKDRKGKDLEWKRQNERELVIIDPRERAREFKADKKKSRRP